MSEKYDDLSQLLVSRLKQWEDARKPQELTMLNCYQDYMRIARDDDTAGTATAKTKKAKGIFIGSTRMKVRAAHAKIVDSLLGNGQLPFDTTPTNEEVREFSDTMEEILTHQLEVGGYKGVLSATVANMAIYGTSFTAGVFVRPEEHKTLSADNSLGINQIKEDSFSYDLPYFEACNSLDSYPDPEARSVDDSMGYFWSRMMPAHTVAAWSKDKSYTNIDKALVFPGDNNNTHGSELASEYRANVQLWFKGDRIKVAIYFGKVPRDLLNDKESDELAIDSETNESEKLRDLVDVIAVVAGGVVVKVNERPSCTNYYKADYENTINEMWGVGVAENNFPHQKITNAAFRLVMEGKGMALLGTKAIDRSKFLPSEDFKKYPGKVYNFRPNLSPDEKKGAIIEFNEPDITNGWMDVINMSQQFSDDDTGITKYQQGDQSGMNKTAAGISMIMGASSLPLKEVIRHIDEMIEMHVEALIDWNLKYLESDAVAAIFGQEASQKWDAIKQFGKASFMDWQATGTSTFMQKEILTQKLTAFSQFALSNPATAQYINTIELLQQTWDAMEIGKESPIKDPNAQDPNAPPQIPPELEQQMQAMQEQIQAMGQALQDKQAEEQFKAAELQLKSRELDIKEMEAQAKIEQANQKANVSVAVNPHNQETDLTEADKLEIQIAADLHKKELDQAHDIKKTVLVHKLQRMAAKGEETDEDSDIDEAGEEKPSMMAECMMKMQGDIAQSQEVTQQLIAQVGQLSAIAAAPKRLIYDDQGNITGSETVI